MRKRNEKGGYRTAADFLGPFLIKMIKIDATNHQKNDHPNIWNLMPKGVPKWSQNRCQNSSKINAKTGNEKDQENHQQSCLSEWWKHWNSLKKQFLDGLEGCVCERERNQTNIKSETKIHSKIHSKIYAKSIQKSCSKKGYPKHGNSSNKWSKK